MPAPTYTFGQQPYATVPGGALDQNFKDVGYYTAGGSGGVTQPNSNKLAQVVNTKDYGTSGVLTSENAAGEFFNALAVTPLGRTTKVDTGQYRFDGAGVSVTGPVCLVGDGAGAGPGAVLDGYCSQVVPNYLTGDVFYVGPTLYGSIFRDLQVNSNLGQRSSGAGIHLDATGLGSVGSNYRINNVAFNNQFYCIQTTQYGFGTIENCYFQQWKQDAIHQSGDGVHEGQAGFVEHNYFFGDTTASTTQNAGLSTTSGYGKICNNFFLGSKVAIRNDNNEFSSNGAFEVVQNGMEEQDVIGVFINPGNPRPAPPGVNH